MLGNKQYDEARILYEFAYGLILHVNDSTALHAMVALEQLAHLSMLQQNVEDNELYLNRILHILKHEAPSTRTVDIEAEEEEEEMDHIIQALNVKAHYSCILSLRSFAHQREWNGMTNQDAIHQDAIYRMKRANDLRSECWKELREKFGPLHAATFAMYLYFGFHSVTIEQFETASISIQYIMTNSRCGGEEQEQEQEEEKRGDIALDKATGGRTLTFLERKRVQELLSCFIGKLLTVPPQRLKFHSLKQLKQQFVYQKQSAKDLKRQILIEKSRREKVRKERLAEMERERENASPRRRIKKEKLNEDTDNVDGDNSAVGTVAIGAGGKQEESPTTTTTATTERKEDMDRDEKVESEEEDEDLQAVDVVDMVINQIALMLRLGDADEAMSMLDCLEREKEEHMFSEQQWEEMRALRAQCGAVMRNKNVNEVGLQPLDLNAVNSKSSENAMDGGHFRENFEYHLHGMPEFMPTTDS